MSETRVGEPGEEPADFKAMEIAADEAPSASDLEDDSEGFEEIVITGQEVVE